MGLPLDICLQVIIIIITISSQHYLKLYIIIICHVQETSMTASSSTSLAPIMRNQVIQHQNTKFKNIQVNAKSVKYKMFIKIHILFISNGKMDKPQGGRTTRRSVRTCSTTASPTWTSTTTRAALTTTITTT